MKNARLEPPSPFSSIHLVPRQQLQSSFQEDTPADGSHRLSFAMPQPQLMSATDSLSTVVPPREQHERKPLAVVTPATMLQELFELLEDYSPVWYTEETHHRAVAALKLAMR